MRSDPDGHSLGFGWSRVRAAAVTAAAFAALVPCARGQVQPPLVIESEENAADEADLDPIWVDHVREGVHRLVWRSAMSVDRLAGSEYGEESYQEASGSLAIAMLWDEFDGWDPQVRFRVDVPLPQLNERYRLFLGRLNPDEFVSERLDPSGAFPRRGRFEEDETLAGIVYSQTPRTGGRFSASVGARVRSPLDPYVKGSYRYVRKLGENTRLSIKETLFWRNSEGFGLTSRLDIEKDFGPRWYMLWSGSATISEESEGVRGYATVTLTHVPKDRHSVSARLLIAGETDAAVAVRDVGVQLAYRRSISRDWLVLEVRTDLTWPKDYAWQSRKPSWGFGFGFEMYFGDEEISTRPVTF